MLERFKWPAISLSAVLALMFAVLSVPASGGTCPCEGTLFEYFNLQDEQTGSKVVCPGFPDQHDGVPSRIFTTSTIECPCP